MSIEQQLFDNCEVDDFDAEYLIGTGITKVRIGHYDPGWRVRFSINWTDSTISIWPAETDGASFDEYALVLTTAPLSAEQTNT